MHLTKLDWIIVVLSLGVTFVPAIVLARRAGRNVTEFFAAGRQAPWWLIGISLVATTFSTDTPNLVTNLVRDGGVAENWVWWSFLLTGMATVFFYARLWRRSGVLTDLEFYELRYAGKAASFVRGFRSIYLGLFFNCVIIATVNLAAVKIASVLFGWPRAETLAICAIVPIVFAATAGLWGVMVTDMIQFCITMTSAFAAAYFAIHAPGVGGLHGLVAHVAATAPSLLSLLPNFRDWPTALAIFVIPLTVQWWSVWYPGAEPGGGSYVAQRMLAARTEADSMFGTLAFAAMHYALRPWPWIVVALASTIVYPSLHDIQARFPGVQPALIGNDIAYPAMLVFLPAGFAGFMVAGIFAAYRSTIETHLNWGTSYLVHDFYQRFVRPGAEQRELVLTGRIVTAALMGVGIVFTLFLDNAKDAFNLLLSIGAGTGLIYLLRWFWWRINAWSEVSAMASSFVVSAGFFAAGKLGHPAASTTVLLVTVAVTTLVWLAVTFATPAVDEAVLEAFYAKVRPAGPGWSAVRRRGGLPPSPDSPAQAFAGWTFGLAAIYGALFATGAFVYGRSLEGLTWGVVSVAGVIGLVTIIRRTFTSET
ncbi:MAG: Na+:solute symporter [Candidatus Eremiobacteraeota bacterium]|nr:Na+:solute symporter [Candidatus Eremiobacteraeota bacterium]MBV8434951.1 Na+:solute symporter [Candidatus Eremiobacteraeota bacterium]